MTPEKGTVFWTYAMPFEKRGCRLEAALNSGQRPVDDDESPI